MIKGLSEGGEFSGWEVERKKFFEDRGKEVEVEMEEKKRRGKEKWEQRDRELQKRGKVGKE